MMSLWDALRMNMMISYQELVRTFLRNFRISIYRYLTFPTRYCINGKHPLDYHG